MTPIVIVTGSPGTGKTTVAAGLAKVAPRGLHIPSDVFFTFPAHPISPYRPAAKEQNTDIMIALARTAVAFAERSWAVFLDGIVGPWSLPIVASEVRPTGIALEYVVLRAPVATCLQRVRAREGEGRDHVVRQMHAQFADLGRFAGHAVDTGELTPDEVVSEVTRRRASFALDMERLA
ncbi:MAG TPA: AAA family ATPase [Candidatus Binatia bacterium]|jgi:predicted kinase|nr:AAA family ATPase [Candidatus Binatia bacterium]